ncbi:MAG: Ig-like domain-containing protein [Candidatus Margulisbacteria bacterium]|nr:Ig-like domain-containing protein [Candidatus Margulisiibacteriota bacterium]
MYFDSDGKGSVTNCEMYNLDVGVFSRAGAGLLVTVTHCTIEGSDVAGIESYSPSSSLPNFLTARYNYIYCTAYDSPSDGIYIATYPSVATLEYNSIIRHGDGIYNTASSAANKIFATNNIISSAPELNSSPGSSSKGINTTSANKIVSTYNNVYNCATNYSGTSEGVGDISQCPQFLDSSTNNFQLYSTSPCIGAASDASNIGAYQGAGAAGSSYRNYAYVNAALGTDDNAHGGGTGASALKTLTYASQYVIKGISAEAGTYNAAVGETFPINLSSNRYLRGAGMNLTTIDADSITDHVIILNNAATVEYVTISLDTNSSNDYAGVSVNGTDSQVRYCKIFSTDTDGYGVQAQSGGSRAYVYKSEIRDFSAANSWGVNIKDGCDGVTVESCTLINNYIGLYTQNSGEQSWIFNSIVSFAPEGSAGGIGLSAAGGGTINARYNDVYNNTTNYSSCTGGVGALTVEAGFVNVPNDDFQLLSTSECINAGDPDPIYNDPDGSRADLGAYYFTESEPETGPSVTLLSPTGSEKWMGGAAYSITWVATAGSTALEVNGATIYYSTDEGTSFVAIASSQPSDGPYSWTIPSHFNTDEARVRVTIDDAGGLQGTGESSSNFIIDSTPPTVPALIFPINDTATNDATPTFLWTHAGDNLSGIASYEVRVDGTSEAIVADVTAYTPTTALTEASHTWEVRARDGAGNWGNFSTFESFSVDLTTPEVTGIVLLDSVRNDRTYSNTLTLTVEAQGVTGSPSHMRMAQDAGFTDNDSGWLAYAQSTEYALTAGEGTREVYYYLKDAAGNTTEVVSSNIIIDTLHPSVESIALTNTYDGGSVYTRSATISLEASGVSAEAVSMQIAEDIDFTTNPTAWLVYDPSYEYTLVGSDGTREVYYKVRDIASNESNTVNSSIILDTTPPTQVVLSSPADGSATNNLAPTLIWDPATDAMSGVGSYEVRWQGNIIVTTEAGTTTYSFAGDQTEASYTWEVRATDVAGNIGAWSQTWTVTLDATAPSAPTLVYPIGGTSTNDATPTFLWNAAADPLSGIGNYEIRIDGTIAATQGAVTVYTPTDPLTEGSHTWDARAKDKAGNWGSYSTEGAFVIDLQRPTVESISLLDSVRNDGTYSNTLTLTVEAHGITGSPSHLRMAQNAAFSDNDSGWLAYSQSTEYALTAGEGTREVFYYIKDSAGNTSEVVSASIIIDTIHPSVESIALTNTYDGGSVYTRLATISLEASGVSVEAVAMNIAEDIDFTTNPTGWLTYNANYEYTLVGSDGTREVYYKVRDIASNESNTVNSSIILDTTPPEQVVLSSPADYSATNDLTPTLAWNAATDITSGIGSYEVRWDGTEVSTQGATTEFTFTVSQSEASHTWEVRAQDKAGNWGVFSSTWTVTLDATAPSTPTLAYPISGVTTNDATPTFLWDAATDPLSGIGNYEIRIDGTVTATVGAVTTWTAVDSLTNSSHTWDARAKDKAGNWGNYSTAGSFIVDSQAPTVEAITLLDSVRNDTTYSSTLTLSIEAQGVVGSPSHMRMAQNAAFSDNDSGWLAYVQDTEYTLTAGEGTREVFYFLKDSLGNTSEVVSSSIIIDTVHPSVESIALKNTYDGGTLYTRSTTISIEASGVSAEAVAMSIAEDIDFTSNPTGWLAYNANYEYTLTASDGTKTVYYKVRDIASNESNIANNSIILDTTAPTAPLLVNPVNTSTNDATPVFMWDTSTATSGIGSYEVRIDGGTTALVTQGATASYTPSVSLSEGSHTWEVRALSKAGWWGSYSTTATVTVDVTAPTVVLYQPNGGENIWGGTTYEITWEATDNLTPQADINIYIRRSSDGGSTWSVPGGPYINDGSQTWNVPELNTSQCRISIEAVDAAQNTGTDMSDANFIVDSTPPTAPALIAPVNTYSNDLTPTFSWSASTSRSGVGSYEVRVDGGTTLLATQDATTSYTPTTSLSEGAHTWEARARNVLDIWGSYASTATVTLDATAPSAPTLVFPVGGTTTNDATPTFLWDAAVDPISGIASYEVRIDGTIVATQGAETYYTPTDPLTEGSHTWDARAKDRADNWGNYSTAGSFIVDTLGPTVESIVLLDSVRNDRTYSSTLILTVEAQGVNGSPSLMRMAQDSGFTDNDSGWLVYAQSTEYTLTAGEGVRSIYYYLKDTLGNTSEVVASSITIDTLHPSVESIALTNTYDGGSIYTRSTTISVEASGVSAEAVAMNIAEDAAFTSNPTGWLTYNVNYEYALAAGDGTKTVYYKVRDIASNESNTVNDSIVLDTTPPTQVTLSSPADNSATNDLTPTLAWTAATDVTSGIGSYEVSWDGTIVSTQGATTSFAFTASQTEASHTWEVRARDKAGNVGQFSLTWTVTLDATAPSTPALVYPISGTTTNDATPTFRWDASTDVLSGVANYEIRVDGTTMATLSASSTSWTIATSLTDASHTWDARAKDNAGNYSAYASAEGFTVDATGPLISSITLTDSVRGDPYYANTLTISVEANGVSGGPAQMRMAQDAGFSDNDSGWLAYAQSTEYLLTAGEGTREVYYYLKDASGNTGEVVSASIIIDTVSPEVGSIILKDTTTGSTTVTSSQTISIEAVTVSAEAVSMRTAQDAAFTTNDTGWVAYSANFTYSLTAGNGLKTVYFKVRDRASNESLSVNNSITLDTNKPAVSSITLRDRNTDSILYTNQTIISIEANSVTGTPTQMKISQDSGFSGAVWQTYSQTVTFEVSSGDGTKTVYYKLQSALSSESDAVNNSITLDTTPPSQVALSTPANGSSVTSQTPTLAWTAATDVTSGIGSYEVTFDGTAITTLGAVTTYTFAQTQTVGSHTWEVRARDKASNWGILSGSWSFTITGTAPTVSVIQPNGGEDIEGGGSYDIKWSAVSAFGVNYINLRYSQNNGGSWIEIVTGEANDGTYSWTVPAIDTQQALVSVEAVDIYGSVGADMSDAVFTIDSSGPTVTIEAPTGGEMVSGLNNSYTIRWSATDAFALAASPISIRYSSNGGTSWSEVASGLSNTGTYSWTVPSVSVTTARISIEAIDAVGKIGTSASVDFTIDSSTPEVSSITPADGETSVSVSTSIIVVFTEAMSRETVEAAFSLSPAAAGSASWSSDSKTYTYTPASHLSYSTDYNIGIGASASNRAGNPISTAFSSIFATEASTDDHSPTVILKVKGVSLKSGDYLPRRPIFTGKISDDLSVDTSSVKMYLDHIEVIPSITVISSSTIEVSYDVLSDLSIAEHVILLTAADTASNYGTQEVTFLISNDTGIKGAVVAYPTLIKPLSGQTSKISYNLTKDTEVAIYVFGMSGRLEWMQKFTAGGNGGRAGYNEILFDAISRISGNAIGNGMYMVKITADNKVIGKTYIVILD